MERCGHAMAGYTVGRCGRDARAENIAHAMGHNSPNGRFPPATQRQAVTGQKGAVSDRSSAADSMPDREARRPRIDRPYPRPPQPYTLGPHTRATPSLSAGHGMSAAPSPMRPCFSGSASHCRLGIVVDAAGNCASWIVPTSVGLTSRALMAAINTRGLDNTYGSAVSVGSREPTANANSVSTRLPVTRRSARVGTVTPTTEALMPCANETEKFEAKQFAATSREALITVTNVTCRLLFAGGCRSCCCTLIV